MKTEDRDVESGEVVRRREGGRVGGGGVLKKEQWF